MTDRGEKLQQLHCYHPFSDSRDTYLTKNHHENYSPKMVPTNPSGSWTKCFYTCVFVCVSVCLCLSRCLSGRFNYEGLVPHKQYFTGTLLGMSSCASYVSRSHDVIDDVTRSPSRSNFEIDKSPSIFELERRSKAQNIGNANGYLFGIFNFRYPFRQKSLSRAQNGGHFLNFEISNKASI